MRASWYGDAAESKEHLSYEMLDSLRLIAEGRLRRIGGGCMLLMAVNILRYLSGLGVRFKGLRSQVKGDVEKVDTFYIGFDCKLKVVLAKCAAYFLLDGLNFSWWEIKRSQTIVTVKTNFRPVTCR